MSGRGACHLSSVSAPSWRDVSEQTSADTGQIKLVANGFRPETLG